MCLDKEEYVFYSLIIVWYVRVPVYRSGSRLHAWSRACFPRAESGVAGFCQGSVHIFTFCILTFIDICV